MASRRITTFIHLMALMFFLFGCSQKKETAQEVQQWMERTFPGQFEIVKTEFTMNQWISTDKSRFNVMLGSKDDPDVQFVLDWNRSLPDGGQTKNGVTARYQKALQEVEQARKLGALLQQNGLNLVSVGKHDQNVDIMVFAEPVPAFREKSFVAIQTALDVWPAEGSTEIRLLFMEEKASGEIFRNLIPVKWVHAMERHLWQQDNCIYYLDFSWPNMRSEALEELLRVNPRALRASAYREDAFKQVQKWAQKNLDKTCRFDAGSLAAEEADEKDPMAIKYTFPYYHNNAEEAEGHLSVVYQTEQKTCSQFKVEKDLF